MTTKSVFIGIDPTAGGRAHSIAILNDRLEILQLKKVATDDLIALATDYDSAVCGIDAPSGPGGGLMADKGYRARLGLAPSASNYSTYRVGEFELRRRKIALYNTPVDPQEAPIWMQVGWRIFNGLREQGYVDYPRPGEKRVFETFPHGGFTALIKHRPYPKSSVRGLLQRQLILYDEGVNVPDPMIILEEWTRHRIMTGQLENRNLYDHDQLDALMAAYTAFLVAREPHNTIAVGDPSEGQIVLPVAELQDSY
jgi:uncharacterized protein DUF429